MPLEIFSRVRAQCYLSSSEEDEVVSRGWWAEQPQSCSSSSFKECHFLYSPESESESEWCSRAEEGSADRRFYWIVFVLMPMAQGFEGRPFWGRVMLTVEQGYRGAVPPPFIGVTPTLVDPEQALVMDKESRFYCCTSLFLEKGLRPF